MNTYKGLVYLKKLSDPDYCKKDKSIGSKGTRGRECDASLDKLNGSGGLGSCDYLCRECNKDVGVKVEVLKEQCNCRFNYCCSIKCDICPVKRKIHYCKWVVQKTDGVFLLIFLFLTINPHLLSANFQPLTVNFVKQSYKVN
jgi:hypothetical protein